MAEQDRFYDWFKADMRANEERQRAMEARIEAHALESEKRLNEHMKQTEARMDEHMKQTEARMDAQMSRIEARFDKIDDKMEVMQTRLEEKIETKLNDGFESRRSFVPPQAVNFEVVNNDIIIMGNLNKRESDRRLPAVFLVFSL